VSDGLTRSLARLATSPEVQPAKDPRLAEAFGGSG